jgi:Ca2+-binding EF-hand superfamily protein
MENQIKISNPLEQRIFDVFSMFEINEEKLVYGEDVGELLRFLGCVPMEKDIEAIIKESETEKGSRECEAQNFVLVVERMIKEGRMKPCSPGKLMKAFITVNPENLEFVTREDLAEIMMKNGETFSEDELNLMIDSSVDPRSGNIDYLKYVMQLMVRNIEMIR